MPRVFVSCRRDDTRYEAQNIYDKLKEHYGAESVVFDVDTIPIGVDFVEYLNQQVNECDVLLAVIGDNWLDVQATDGTPRIDDPKDFVRIEIQAALKRKIPVIPVLVDNASMPSEAELPRGLKQLSRRNAAEVRPGRDLQRHLKRLVRDVDATLELVSRPRERRTSVASRAKFTPEDVREDIITNSIGMRLRLLPPGNFLIGIYPVTQKEYEGVMRTNPSEFQNDNRRPVERVSWYDAIDFCNRLSGQEGLPAYYDVDGGEVSVQGGVGYRLPTEAEWEYACRADSEGAYCFGDDKRQLTRYAWFLKNSEGTTHPVGEKLPNAWGLYDMHGNVWEWCWDFDAPCRVVRGGCWWDGARDCRAAFRSGLGPQYRLDGLGFRVAAVPPGKTSQ